jgi:hypothetical protein
MSDLRDKVRDEFEMLKRVRDELRVQMHLGKAEVKERWETLEHKFNEAEAKVKIVASGAGEPLTEVSDTARLLLEEIREGYRRIRSVL